MADPRTYPPRPADNLPDAVLAALNTAQTAGFPYSCSDQVGRLLATLALARPGGRIAESGTGYGVGTAWLHSGLRPDARLHTVERDPVRALAAEQLFADDDRVLHLTGDWTLLRAFAPFDLFFCDGGGKREDPDGVVDLLAPGGTLVLDDFTPDFGWPPRFDGEPDEVRIRYLTHPLLHAVQVQIDADAAAVIATRR